MVVTKICKIKMDFKKLSSKKAVLQYILNLGEILSEIVKSYLSKFEAMKKV